MKKINNKNPPPSKGFEGITIGDEELNESEKIAYSCNNCYCSLVRLSDRNNQNESWYCNRCSIEFPDTKQIQFKQKLTNPHYEEVEPAVSIVNVDYTKDVEIRHPKELRGGIAELQKRGLKITYFDDSSQR